MPNPPPPSFPYPVVDSTSGFCASITLPPSIVYSPSDSAVSLAHQINGVGKGTEGATEQLKKVGDAVTQDSRKKPDWLAALGEVRNLMAPETPGTARLQQLSENCQSQSSCVLRVTKQDERFGFKLPVTKDPPHTSNGPSLTRGLKIITNKCKLVDL
ncbi:hypothetical protein L210DRAFT_3507425 [Boletus edulis BED1]|uniref:Uncharacterized protein n=1 Tax=Boletus edulis BED1 TaxID=1328754 RepID=A0AAD4G9J6_BOLED|nr:hypothetical protein L210DRAFT_3507425 [Boletus edulis BED1]